MHISREKKISRDVNEEHNYGCRMHKCADHKASVNQHYHLFLRGCMQHVFVCRRWDVLKGSARNHETPEYSRMSLLMRGKTFHSRPTWSFVSEKCLALISGFSLARASHVKRSFQGKKVKVLQSELVLFLCGEIFVLLSANRWVGSKGSSIALLGLEIAWRKLIKWCNLHRRPVSFRDKTKRAQLCCWWMSREVGRPHSMSKCMKTLN